MHLHRAHLSQARVARDMLASLTGADELEDEDALEEYLEAPPRATVKDPLAYWNAALASSSEDPALVHMALDYLSIPGTLPICTRCAWTRC